jgi:hypothetical protein
MVQHICISRIAVDNSINSTTLSPESDIENKIDNSKWLLIYNYISLKTGKNGIVKHFLVLRYYKEIFGLSGKTFTSALFLDHLFTSDQIDMFILHDLIHTYYHPKECFYANYGGNR